MTIIKFCCETFSDRTKKIEEKGFGIIPASFEGSDIIYFCVLFKNYDNNYPGEAGSKLVQSEMSIKYCPWCGSELQIIIDQNKKPLMGLIELNKKILKIPPDKNM